MVVCRHKLKHAYHELFVRGCCGQGLADWCYLWERAMKLYDLVLRDLIRFDGFFGPIDIRGNLCENLVEIR